MIDLDPITLEFVILRAQLDLVMLQHGTTLEDTAAAVRMCDGRLRVMPRKEMLRHMASMAPHLCEELAQPAAEGRYWLIMFPEDKPAHIAEVEARRFNTLLPHMRRVEA